MIPLMLVVSAAIFALAAGVIAAMGGGPSKLVKQRLLALQWESAPTQFEETTDIRKKEHTGGTAWLNRWMVRINVDIASAYAALPGRRENAARASVAHVGRRLGDRGRGIYLRTASSCRQSYFLRRLFRSR